MFNRKKALSKENVPHLHTLLTIDYAILLFNSRAKVSLCLVYWNEKLTASRSVLHTPVWSFADCEVIPYEKGDKETLKK